MNWKRKYDQWQVIFGNLTSIALVFAGGYLMTMQPSGVEGSSFAAGLWATILGVGMMITATLVELRTEIPGYYEDDN